MIIRKANVGRGICPRVPFIELLLLVLVCVLAACANNFKATEQYPDVCDYVMQDSEEPVKPTVSLKDNNKFIFTYSLLSSYFAVGSYEVSDGSLILRTDDEN